MWSDVSRGKSIAPYIRKPLKGLAGVGYVLSGYALYHDIKATWRSPFSTNKKILKTRIIVVGSGASIGIGYISMLPGPWVGIPVSTIAAFGISMGQDYLYNKWGLR